MRITFFILFTITFIFAEPLIGGGDHDKVPQRNPLIGGGDHDYVPHGNPLIGGGDHDKVPHGNPLIGGGDHDYVAHGNPLIGGGDHDKVPHGNPLIGAGDYDKVPQENSLIGGGDHDKVPHGNSLIGGGDHDKVPHGNSLIGGGDHDKVPHNYGEPHFGGNDHDIVAHKIVELTKILEEKTVEELRDYSLKLESYSKSKSQEQSLGGLHDYIFTMSSDDCMKYILAVSLRNSELLDKTFFLSIITEKKSLSFIGEETNTESNHAYLYQLDRETLVSFAFTTEKYELAKRGINKNIRGGLHDLIFNMSNTKVANYIINHLNKYPEVDNLSTLQEMSISYGFSKKRSFKSGGGLHDYIWREPRDVLEKWALTCEFHYNYINNIQVLGGLHDYIFQMTNQELGSFILKKAQELPELNNAENLNSFYVKYGIRN
jgi:hypothetical protein